MMIRETLIGDMPQDGWIGRAPASARPYLRLMRLDRPIGTWLLLFPCWWSQALAADPWPHLGMMVLFAIGAVVMRGAGCTYNDIVDRDFDAKVERTAQRPIPSGQVTRRQAAWFLLAQLLVGFAVLLCFNTFAIWLGVASLVLVFTYPFMKRFTYWPQAWLGLTFTYGALMGWAGERADLGWPAILLYVACFFWTLHYDTIYAHQDREDDLIVGVKSSALALGARTKPALAGFSLIMIVLIGIAGALAGLGPLFWPLLLAALGHLMWQLWALDINNSDVCLALFKSNRFVGWILLAAFVAGQVSR
ncbi:4-hydroxybenzoate octaprenyltransferase [Pararhodospirillum photometricum]|uniref:4-hydroxybenzoate octaprenyltransferase n=1 Tax=Pararhodospirillum photometricum DSM 122 TaxID=1150469 RepID=H6SNR5_PARPM|nr:4-hydroxybenzoate octaprenyltransferase [Pararhodospirillum photometricum]CCG09396.1 4-hydroxybenzoate octaprenyltransferase [Pararhodospirillum photometricum DSM 122]